MIRILFVCHGNICRSTMAHFVMQHRVNQEGLAGHYRIDSAAVSREELGNPPHYGTCNKLSELGIPVLKHASRQITAQEYDDWDHIIVMDSSNERLLARIIPADPEHKISRLMSWVGEKRDVADPWYTGDFDATYLDVSSAVEAILQATRPHR